MAAAKKTTTKAPAKPRAPRPTAKTIRNIRGTQVHARLSSKTPKDPFRIALQPRGQSGDMTVIPVDLQNDITYISGVGVLWEVITAAEAQQVQQSYASVGYLGRTDAPQVIRPNENTVLTAKDWDGEGRRVPQDREKVVTNRTSEREFGTGLHTVDLPGTDAALHQLLKAGQDALPPDVDLSSRRVVIERTKGE